MYSRLYFLLVTVVVGFSVVEITFANEATPAQSTEGLSSWDTLKKVSAVNLVRMSAQYKVVSSPETAEAEEILAGIHLVTIHASNSMKDLPPEPILSARQLEKNGMPIGLNTRDFNRNLLGSDDNVFFVVGDSLNPEPPQPAPNVYGHYQIGLKREYMDQAWISGFVMYPNELLDLGKFIDPETVKTIQQSQYDMTKEPALWMQEQSSNLMKLRNKLHLLDFTPDDFLKFMKAVKLYTLVKTKQDDPVLYRTIVNQIKSNQRKSLFC